MHRPSTPTPAGLLQLLLLCVCVNHYLRCSQHNGTSWENGLCDAGERCSHNTELKEGPSREDDGGREGGEGREEVRTGPKATNRLTCGPICIKTSGYFQSV